MTRKYAIGLMSVTITALTLLVAVSPGQAAGSEKTTAEYPNISIGGAYLGLFNTLSQEESADTDAKRTQFDYAANLDFSIWFNKHVSAFVQLQGGPGGGSLGLTGPTVVVTDVYATYHHPDYPLAISFGSFDTPFGYETKFLNNNGAAMAHPFILNSLFFSGFAGGPITTLNSLGLKAEYTRELFDLTGAITNGTSQTANNADGNFEFLAAGGIHPIPDKDLRIGLAYMNSDDREQSGFTGKMAEFEAYLVEGHFVSEEGISARAFVGQMIFGDNNDATEDKVTCLTAELGYTDDMWHIAGRFSTWSPEDHNGDNAGFSPLIPNAGLAVTLSGQPVYRDQQIKRMQFGGGYRVFPNVMAKAEFFLDDYDKSSNGQATDVTGFILALTGAF